MSADGGTDNDDGRARIVVLDEHFSKSETIPVDFNPTEVSVDKSVTFAEQGVPGLDAPIQQFVNGDAKTLSVELLFDAYEDDDVDDVREYTDAIDGLLSVDGDLHAPPVVRFVWGSIEFTSVIESANTTFTMFSRSGTPVRARMDVTFREFALPEDQRRDEPRHSPDTATVHRVTEGDTLWGIAAAEYGSPTEWRTIARANDVENPRRLEPGDELAVPPLE